MGTVDGGLPALTETPPAWRSCSLREERGESHSGLGFLGACLTPPPSFTPTQRPLAWMEARVRMEVAAPSCPPGRLPACECLALSHEWALSGEAVCLLPLPLCSSQMLLPLPTCVWLGQPLVSPLNAAELGAVALESAWPGFKSHIMLLMA